MTSERAPSQLAPTAIYDCLMLGQQSGASEHVVGMAVALTEAGTHVVVVTSAVAVHNRLVANGVPVHLVRATTRLGMVPYYLLLDLKRIVLTWTLLRTLASDVRYLARLAPLNTGVVVARLLRKRVVLEVNGPMLAEADASRWPWFLRRFAGLSERLQLGLSTSAIAVTPGLAAYAESRGARRCAVIPNGAVAPAKSRSRLREQARIELGLGPNDLAVLYAGTAPPWYDLDWAVDAVASTQQELSRKTVLILAGVEAECKPRTSGKGTSGLSLLMTGWLSPERLAEVMAAADIGLVPLTAKGAADEAIGSPLKLYTYLSGGLTVVAANVDGVREVVSEHVFKYTPLDMTSFQEALRAAELFEKTYDGPPPDPSEWSWSDRADRVRVLLRS